MKIVKVSAIPMSAPVPEEKRHRTDLGTKVKSDATLIRVETDNGLTGAFRLRLRQTIHPASSPVSSGPPTSGARCEHQRCLERSADRHIGGKDADSRSSPSARSSPSRSPALPDASREPDSAPPAIKTKIST